MIYLTIGVPASGKSTWAKEFIKDNPDTIRVCRDDLRLMLGGTQMLDGPGEMLVTKLVEHAIANKGKKNIIVDQTNCNLKYMKRLVYFARSFDSVKLLPFPMNLETCIERDDKRIQGRVGPDVIKRMHEGFSVVYDEYNLSGCDGVLYKNSYASVIKRKDNILSNRPKAVIFDLDGTLAHMDNRRSPYEWNKVGLDRLDVAVKDSLLAHQQTGKKIIILSGRDGVCREETELWLKDNYITYDLLLMREVNDIRKDFFIKEEIYRKDIEPFYDVVAIFDDRPSVCRMWQSIGLKVFNCGDGIEF